MLITGGLLVAGLLVVAATGPPFTIGSVAPAPTTRTVLVAPAPPVAGTGAAAEPDASSGANDVTSIGDPAVTVTPAGDGAWDVEVCGDLELGGSVEVRFGDAADPVVIPVTTRPCLVVTIAAAASTSTLTVTVPTVSGSVVVEAVAPSTGDPAEVPTDAPAEDPTGDATPDPTDAPASDSDGPGGP